MADLTTCPQCEGEKETHEAICSRCQSALNSRKHVLRKPDRDWMVVAEEAGIRPWERQPQETDREWQIWLAYRDAYPAKRPSVKEIADQQGVNYSVAKNASTRWNYPARMQAWAKYVDDLTMMQRREEIINMNQQHISMANAIREKISTAIQNMDPYNMKPGEIKDMMRMMVDVERQARLHETTGMQDVVLGQDEKEVKKSPTKQNDLDEVIKILSDAGALKGVRRTTEVVLNDNMQQLRDVEESE